jgi:glycosyltransferase involved in cell wall biosynthesis
MLTPDVGFLDRRIAQEAETLVGTGWSVTIHAAVDPQLRWEAPLAPGVHLTHLMPARGGSGRIVPLVRSVKRRLSARAPAVARALESAQYRTIDRAGLITRENGPQLLGGPRADLVVAHDVPVLPLALHLRSAWKGRVICDLHEAFSEQEEYLLSTEARRYWRRVEAEGLARTDGVMAVNAGVLEWAHRAIAAGTPTAVVHNAVPFIPRERLTGPSLRVLYPISADHRILLFAGTLLPSKNLTVLVEAMADPRLAGWALAFLGTGPLAGALAERAQACNVADRVFVGLRVPQQDLVGVCASADLGLLPYEDIGFNHKVATPNKLYEYAQARIPIASSDLPQIRPILTSLGNGGLMSFADTVSVVEGLRRIIDEVLPAADDATLERAADELSWEHESGNLLRLVETVFEASRPA